MASCVGGMDDTFPFLLRARMLSRHVPCTFHEVTCIFSRDKTELTMGKPEVNNSTFIPSLIQFYLIRNIARVIQNIVPDALLTQHVGPSRFLYFRHQVFQAPANPHNSSPSGLVV